MTVAWPYLRAVLHFDPWQMSGLSSHRRSHQQEIQVTNDSVWDMLGVGVGVGRSEMGLGGEAADPGTTCQSRTCLSVRARSPRAHALVKRNRCLLKRLKLNLNLVDHRSVH